MNRTLTAVAASLVALSAAPSAMAQPKGDFGQQGQFIISADRLFQLFSYDNVSQGQFGPLPLGVKSIDVTTNSSSLSFLYGSTAQQIEQFFTVPRAGFDYVVVPNVTVGGDLVAIFSLGGSQKLQTNNNDGSSHTDSLDNPSVVGFGVAPRGGYVLNLNDMLSLWLRGGLSFYTSSVKTSDANANTTTTNSVNQLALDLEPQVVFHPVQHIGFTGGIYADIPLAGGHSRDINRQGSTTSDSAGSSIFYLGLDVAMLVYF